MTCGVVQAAALIMRLHEAHGVTLPVSVTVAKSRRVAGCVCSFEEQD